MREALPARVVAHVKRRGLGAVAPPSTAVSAYNQANTDWQNQVVAVINAGDTYLNEGSTAQALSSYQAAGAAGATSLGPEIDLIGYPRASQPWTQKAWKLNTLLAATTSVADAQTFVKNMSLFYQIALSAVADRINGISDETALPSLGGSQIAYAAGLAILAGGAWSIFGAPR